MFELLDFDKSLWSTSQSIFISFIIILNGLLNIISYLPLPRSLLNYESKKELGKAEKRNVLWPNSCKLNAVSDHIICIFIKFRVRCHDHLQDDCRIKPYFSHITKTALWIIHHSVLACYTLQTYGTLMRSHVEPCSLNTAEQIR